MITLLLHGERLRNTKSVITWYNDDQIQENDTKFQFMDTSMDTDKFFNMNIIV